MRRLMRVFVEDDQALIKVEIAGGHLIALRAHVNEREEVVLRLDHGQLILEPISCNEVRLTVKT
jgi:hypothetical protein